DLTARGEPHHAHSTRVDAPLGGAAAYESHGALSVLARMFVERVRRVLFPGEAVLQSESRDPEAVEEFCRVIAFSVEHQETMAAAGGDHNRSSGSLLLPGQVDRDGGIVDVADVVILRDRDFVAFAFEPGCAVRP